MTNEEKILEMLYTLQKGQEQMKTDIEEIRSNIADIKDGQDELRLSVNAILGWTDKVSEAVNFPLPQI